jgi:DHA3 family macrolide efflux protein-like MFS transporter
MVPKEELSRVAGMNQTLQGALNVVGPALGAGLVSVMPLHGTLAIDVGTALIAIFLLLLVEIPQPENHRDETVTILQDLASGFNYVWSWPGLFAILIIAALLNFVSAPAFSLLPLLVTERFSGGVARVGFMNSTLGAGLLLGGLVLSAWGGFSSKILTSMTALIGGGVGMLLTGISPPGAFWLAVTGIFVEGFMNPIINGPFFALIQEKVAPEMQGRVFTLVMSFSMAVSPLGMALAGPVGDRFGVNVWFALAGVTMIGSGALSLLSPTIRNIEQQQAEDSEAVQETAAPTPEPVLAGD